MGHAGYSDMTCLVLTVSCASLQRPLLSQGLLFKRKCLLFNMSTCGIVFQRLSSQWQGNIKSTSGSVTKASHTGPALIQWIQLVEAPRNLLEEAPRNQEAPRNLLEEAPRKNMPFDYFIPCGVMRVTNIRLCSFCT